MQFVPVPSRALPSCQIRAFISMTPNLGGVLLGSLCTLDKANVIELGVLGSILVKSSSHTLPET